MTAYAFAIELDALLKGRTVESALRLAGGMTIVFSGEGRRFLHIVSAGRESEIILAGERLLPEEVSKPFFSDLPGTEVVSVEPLGLDRVILIRFNEKKSWGESETLTLRIDLSPVFRTAALFREGARHALETFGAPGSRPPGSPDQLPPSKRWSLLGLPEGWDFDIPAVEDEPDSDLSSLLVRAVGGIDPLLSKALTARFGSDPEGLTEAVREIGARLSSGDFAWKIYDLPDSGDRGTCAVYPVAIPFDPRPDSPDDMPAVFDMRSEEKVLPVYTVWLKKAASKHYRHALKKTRRLLANVEEDLDSARRAEEMRYMGNLLVTWRHRIRKGMDELTAMDFNGEDEITIPLDPALDPEKNIQTYFRRAKKGDKGLEIIKARRASIRKDIEDLEKSIARTEAIEDPAGLAAMIIPEGASVSRTGKVRENDKPRFKSFPVDETHTILVGKSDRENDELTHRYAKPTDLWFHAMGSPGSHVILRGANRSTPASVIEMAAEVAAWFSKARGSGTVPVICAEKRYVRRPRGAKPGTASCIRSKTLFVTPRIPE
jgi:predicted ribosome quality control (RQC) complex YloA/Tae2 family protein